MNDDPKRLRKAAAYLECFDCPVEALSTDHILPRGERRKELT